MVQQQYGGRTEKINIDFEADMLPGQKCLFWALDKCPGFEKLSVCEKPLLVLGSRIFIEKSLN